MGPHPEAQMQVDTLKAADHSGYQQIIRPSRGMQAGLKILVSLVWSADPFETRSAHLRPGGWVASRRSVFSKLLESRTSAVASTIQSEPPI